MIKPEVFEHEARMRADLMAIWKDGRCEWHDFLNAKDECDDCLDDAHEAWLRTRGQS